MKISKGQRVAASGIIIAAGLILMKLELYTNKVNIILLAAAYIAGYPIALNAIRTARYKILGIDALVTLAVIGAVLIGENFEAAAVTFLFMLGNYLESKTLEKTRFAIKAIF
ncbi:cation-translocating P-type ATPase [Clostridium sp. YIM B02515]|uniref:Cation-translocating P-type ATPase n=1 Tax=Clostridium rhizosphaerae TaxID=2803861 RepID=A0ABS1TFT8_9CLOT|nr:cation-translocating P-type ATPase [Clostridium rhizosphaerae]MBL4938235.1 cation-translocating P-type ATPase [Clostridium rhizosphaerae]